MWELRWILFGLGVLLIAGVYLLGRGMLRLPSLRRRALVDGNDASEQNDPQSEQPHENQAPEQPLRSPSPPLRDSDRIVTVRFIPKEVLNGERAVLALRKFGLQHGRYGIFHRFGESEEAREQPLFSVANLTEPGSFALNNLDETTVPGMSFFMVLPGVGDPVERFDLMVGTAHSLAHELGAELFDEKGSSWSIQRERYVREEIIEYRHQYAKL